MTRKVDHTVSADVPAEVLYRLLTSQEYWEDLVGFWKSCNLNSELKHLSTDAGGTEVHFAHIMTAQDLPAIARPVVPGQFIVMREQHFDPFDPAKQRAGGRYTARITHAPVDITGQLGVAANGAGSQLELSSNCKVKVPLIGGKIEGLLATAVKNLFTTEGNHTTEWVATHS
ncbi:MAG: DUF2505 domain-containing protein [Mycobacterium sp.]|nr:DUF2505 domain-containing protein [Mycobacterium sp.]